MHLCELSIEVVIQARQVSRTVSKAAPGLTEYASTHFAVEKVFAKTQSAPTYAAVVAMIDGFVLAVLP